MVSKKFGIEKMIHMPINPEIEGGVGKVKEEGEEEITL